VTTRRRPEEALITAAVRTLRAGDEARGPRATTVTGPASGTDAPSLSTASIVTVLRSALTDSRPLWIGYADTDGTVAQQIVDPIRLHGGVLTAFDHRTDSVRQFSVSRVTGVAELADAEATT
jgi:predicted DNA-binding transcriptional regulator YafY